MKLYLIASNNYNGTSLYTGVRRNNKRSYMVAINDSEPADVLDRDVFYKSAPYKLVAELNKEEELRKEVYPDYHTANYRIVVYNMEG